MILDLPDPRAKGRPIEGYECGDLAVRCVMRFHGLRQRERLVALSEPVHGADPASLTSFVVSPLGEPLRWAHGSMTVPDLRHYADTGRPVLTLVQADTADGRTEGHYVVVAGVARRRVHYLDPFSGMRAMREAEWDTRWHDTGRFGTLFRRWGLVAWPET